MGTSQHVQIAAAPGKQIGIWEKLAFRVRGVSANTRQQLTVSQACTVVAQIRMAIEGRTELAEVPALDKGQFGLADIATGQHVEQRPRRDPGLDFVAASLYPVGLARHPGKQHQGGRPGIDAGVGQLSGHLAHAGAGFDSEIQRALS